jgi:hypothetical protein
MDTIQTGYTVVSSEDYDEFKKQVEARMVEGWHVTLGFGVHNGWFYQPMVKTQRVFTAADTKPQPKQPYSLYGNTIRQ